MIERVDERFGLYPEKLAADTAYGAAEMLGWLVYEKGIEPHIAVFDKSRRDDNIFSRADFVYDHGNDLYRCPRGKELRESQRPRGPTVDEDRMLRYRASKMDRDACELKTQCCPNTPHETSLAKSMKGRGTWRAISPKPMPS